MHASHRRPLVPIVRMALPMLVSALAGCQGGGEGDGSTRPFALADVNAESLGSLPVSDGYLDSRIVFRFSKDVDPTSVTSSSIRVVLDGSPTVSARGNLLVSGSDVLFGPRLPTRVDLTDVAYDVGAIYRVEIGAGASGPRGRDGTMLRSSYRSTFAVRMQPPLFSDRHPGPPRVIGVLVDLDGDGVLEGDGLCRAARQPEQFLDARAAEYASCASQSDLFDLLATPLASRVPVGAAARPFKIGLLFSEPLTPASVFAGTDVASGGISTSFRVTDVSRQVDTDGDGQLDSDRALPFRVALVEAVHADGTASGQDFVVVVLEVAFTAPPLSLIRVEALSGVVELTDPNVEISPFRATVQTDSTPPTEDEIVEEFDDARRLGRSTTASWSCPVPGTLRSGPGFGGTGIDGAFPPTGGGTSFVLDTNANEGFFQFTSFTIPAGVTVTATGSNPLRILSIGNATLAGTLHADGQPGESGVGDDSTTRLGGAGGPGGERGGRAIAPTNPSNCSASTPCVSETGEGLGGGTGGRRANNASGSSGGGGSGSFGTNGGPSPGGGQPGQPGSVYGNPAIEPLLGGSGGGAGGNKPGNAQFPRDSSGGGGGGGGGAILIQSNGTVDVSGVLTANGGGGGAGFFAPGVNPPPSAGGGGGSGGAIKIQARRIARVADATSARGGMGGARIGNEGGGGIGGLGRIRLEDDGGLPSFGPLVTPAPSTGLLDARARATSVAQSQWIDTNAPSARFAFDGSDPVTGLARLAPDGTAAPGVTDVAYASPVDSRFTVRFLFAGAQAKPTNPNEPDLATETGFVPNIHAIDGHPFIRFRIEFEGTARLDSLPEVVIDRIRIRFSYP